MSPGLEIDPPVTDPSGEDLEYEDPVVNMVEDLEEERDQENEVPIPILAPRFGTLFPGVVFQSLIPIEDPAPVVPSVEVNPWFIPPVYHRCIYPLDEYSAAHVDPVLDYVESVTLGAEGVLPGRHFVSLLRVFKQFTYLIPSV